MNHPRFNQKAETNDSIVWIFFTEEQMDPVAQSTFYMLFTHQFEGNIEQMRKNFAFTCPILDIGFVRT